jgi:hypothetical protein
MRARIVAWSLVVCGIALTALFHALDLLNGHRHAPPIVGTFVGVAFLIVGALIALRRPRNPIGWLYLVALTLISFGGSGNVSEQYAYYAVVTQPGALPAPEWVLWAGAVVLVPAFSALIFFSLLLFPDGRLPSRRWRPVAAAAALAVAALTIQTAFASGPLNSAGVQVDNPVRIDLPALPVDLTGVFFTLLGLLIIAVLVASVAAIFLRFRAATGVERQQLKWFAYGAACIPAVGLLAIGLSVLAPHGVPGFDASNLWPLSVAGIPIATAIAILRYRLYDIDVLIRRTLIYASLSAVLLGAYVGGVALLETLLAPLTGGNGVAVAISTLIVVALFQPLRRRIQSAVDHRFFRAKYDAQRTLDAFAARLRDEIDLDSLERELVDAVRETVQPTHASVWLRKATS